MVEKLGGAHLHEIVISHVRGFLDGEFANGRVCETPKHFLTRMNVAKHMDSASFMVPDGRGLEGLSKILKWRCEVVVRLKGERIPK